MLSDTFRLLGFLTIDQFLKEDYGTKLKANEFFKTNSRFKETIKVYHLLGSIKIHFLIFFYHLFISQQVHWEVKCFTKLLCKKYSLILDCQKYVKG